MLLMQIISLMEGLTPMSWREGGWAWSYRRVVLTKHSGAGTRSIYLHIIKRMLSWAEWTHCSKQAISGSWSNSEILVLENMKAATKYQLQNILRVYIKISKVLKVATIKFWSFPHHSYFPVKLYIRWKCIWSCWHWMNLLKVWKCCIFRAVHTQHWKQRTSFLAAGSPE